MFHSVSKLTLLSVLAAPTLAQWGTIAQHPFNSITAGAGLVTHENAQGIHAFSAMAQQWTMVSPPGSFYRGTGDYYVVTLEGTTAFRGWSARRNSSAVQTVSTNVQGSFGSGDVYGLIDSPPASPQFVRAYSAITNTWASVALTAPALTPLYVGRSGVVMYDGTRYLGFAARTGQWVALPVTTEGRSPQRNEDVIAIDLAGNSGLGPRRIAAFSGVHGTWSVSPIYPTTGAGLTISNRGALTRVELPNPAQVSFAGYSPYHAQWTTSSLVHNTASSIQTTGYHYALRVLDSDPAARYEIFGGGSGVWNVLTGTNLTEAAVHQDFTFVANNTTATMYACSLVADRGWTSVSDSAGTISAMTPGSRHAGMVLGLGNNGQMWGYSAANNTFTAPAPCPTAGQVWTGGGGAVVGYNVTGSAGNGTHVQGCAARWGGWVPGPLTSSSYQTLSGGSVLMAYETFNPGGMYQLNLFDEHRNQWRTPYSVPTSFTLQLGENMMAAWPQTTGTVHLYSSHRGDWTTILNVAPITSAGAVNFTEGLAWWTSNNQVYACSSLDVTHSWFEWPLSPEFTNAGTAPGAAAAPFAGLSIRGTPSELAFVYASLTLAPAPISVPGIGSLDLDPAGAVFLATLGPFDADGLLEFQVALPNAVLGLPIWFQALTYDTLSGQPHLPGRASATWLF